MRETSAIITEGLSREGILRLDSVEAALVESRKTSPANSWIWRALRTDSVIPVFKEGRKTITFTARDWLGVDSFDEVDRVIEHGWPEGVKRLLEAFKDIKTDAIPADIKRRKSKGDQGDEIDMQAVYAGNLPKAWNRTRRAAKTAVKHVTIIADLSLGYKRRSDTLFWRGAAALYLADILTAAGFSVGIVAAHVGELRYETKPETPVNSATLIDVKRHDMPLDMSALASSLCMAGFMRNICFRIRTAHKEPLESSLAKPSTLREMFPAEADAMHAIEGLGDVYNKQEAIDWINEQLSKLTKGEQA